MYCSVLFCSQSRSKRSLEVSKQGVIPSDVRRYYPLLEALNCDIDDR